MKERFKAAWAGWKKIAHRIGNFNARVLLSLFYIVISLPFSLIAKAKNPLHLDSAHRDSFWLDRPTAKSAAESSRRQF